MPSADFHKYHALGNDFVLVDALSTPELATLDWTSLARRLCDRHTGIGADGVLVLSSTPHASAAMRIVNADGSEGEMCGNGLRCAARHLFELHSTARSPLSIQTPKGVVQIAVESTAGSFLGATVDMGEPRLAPNEIPLSPEFQDPRHVPLAGTGLVALCVNMGNPHAVIFVDGAEPFAIDHLGPLIERLPAFPERTNVQVVSVQSRTLARLRTWERGAGRTLACGTGACAALVAGVLADRLDRHATIRVDGGDLSIAWDRDTNHVRMSGPATRVYTGSIDLASA